MKPARPGHPLVPLRLARSEPAAVEAFPAILQAEEVTAAVSVVIVIPIDGDLVESPEHLGPAYLLASLRRAGISCRLIEAWPGRDAEVVAAAKQCAPVLIGVTLTTVSAQRIMRLGNGLRQAVGPDVHIVVGGPVATHRAGELFSLAGWEFIDSVARGEAEELMVELARVAISGQPVVGIAGLICRGPGGVSGPPPAPPRGDLDHLPWPARDQLMRHGRALPYVRISGSRGCSSRCTFCNAPHAGNRIAGGKPWRGRSPQSVLDELEHLVRCFGVRTFDFVDSTFEDPGGGTLGKTRVRAIAAGILERGLDIFYNVCMQAQNWSEDDRDLIRLLVRSGMEKVLIGIESGSPRGLARWRKRATVADNIRALRLLRSHGVYVAFGFIMFHPFADLEEVDEAAEFLLEHLGHNVRRLTTRLELYPGAEVVEELRACGLLAPEFDTRLAQYGYQYRDERVAAFADAMASLFGAEYRDHGTIAGEPSAFAFETYDIRLHTYLFRLARIIGDGEPGYHELQALRAAVADTHRAMTGYNRGFYHRIRELVTAGRASPERLQTIAGELETYYAAQMKELRVLQLRYGLKIRRQARALELQALL